MGDQPRPPLPHRADADAVLQRLWRLLGILRQLQRGGDRADPAVGGLGHVYNAAPDWPTVKNNAKLIVLWGANPVVCTRVLSLRWCTKQWLDLKGGPIELISIDPVRNETAQQLGARWMPDRANSDVAMMLAMMHVLLTEKLHDVKFLADYTVGFAEVRKIPDRRKRRGGEDAGLGGEDHRRAGGDHHRADPQDGGDRAPPSPRLFDPAGAPRRAAAVGAGGAGLHAGAAWPARRRADLRHAHPGERLPGAADADRRRHHHRHRPGEPGAPDRLHRDALLNPGKTIQAKGRDITYPDIRLIYTAGGNQFTHHQDTNRFIQAIRQPETVIVQTVVDADGRFADIVLPAASDLERNDIGQVLNLIVASKAAVAPQFKSRTDYDIFTEVADRLGTREKFTEGRDEMAWLKFFYDAARAQSKAMPMPDFEHLLERRGHPGVPRGQGQQRAAGRLPGRPAAEPAGIADRQDRDRLAVCGEDELRGLPGPPDLAGAGGVARQRQGGRYPLQ